VNVVRAFFFFDLSLVIVPESDAPLFSPLADAVESPLDAESPKLSIPLHGLELIIFFNVLFGVLVDVSNVDFVELVSFDDELIDESFFLLTPLLAFNPFLLFDILLLLSLEESA